MSRAFKRVAVLLVLLSFIAGCGSDVGGGSPEANQAAGNVAVPGITAAQGAVASLAINAVNMPVRQAFAAEMVPRRDLLNAIALYRSLGGGWKS